MDEFTTQIVSVAYAAIRSCVQKGDVVRVEDLAAQMMHEWIAWRDLTIMQDGRRLAHWASTRRLVNLRERVLDLLETHEIYEDCCEDGDEEGIAETVAYLIATLRWVVAAEAGTAPTPRCEREELQAWLDEQPLEMRQLPLL